MLYEYIVKLQKELELKEPLGGPNDDMFAIGVDDAVININDDPPGFKLSCTLDTLPTQQVEDFLTMMLRGNLFGQATRFASLGLDESGNKVIMQYKHPIKASYQDFRNAMEDFINVVDYWKGQIKNHPAPT
jgi:hypothetical protein